jgi:hypothetical protein
MFAIKEVVMRKATLKELAMREFAASGFAEDVTIDTDTDADDVAAELTAQKIARIGRAAEEAAKERFAAEKAACKDFFEWREARNLKPSDQMNQAELAVYGKYIEEDFPELAMIRTPFDSEKWKSNKFVSEEFEPYIARLDVSLWSCERRFFLLAKSAMRAGKLTLMQAMRFTQDEILEHFAKYWNETKPYVSETYLRILCPTVKEDV